MFSETRFSFMFIGLFVIWESAVQSSVSITLKNSNGDQLNNDETKQKYLHLK